MKKNLDDNLSVKRIVRSKKLREKLGSEKYRMTRAFASWARSQQPTSRLAARLHDATDRRSPHRSCFGGSLMLMLLIRVAIFFSRAFSLDLFPSRCRFVCSNVISWFMQLAEKFIFFSRAMFSCRARRATKYVFFSGGLLLSSFVDNSREDFSSFSRKHSSPIESHIVRCYRSAQTQSCHLWCNFIAKRKLFSRSNWNLIVSRF